MRHIARPFVLLPFLTFESGASAAAPALTGDLEEWHALTISFEGPEAGEAPPGARADPNPFRDFRLLVTFRHPASGRSYRVPGSFAADGDAGRTGASRGRVWRVRFMPEGTGEWTWKASFRKGPGIAVRDDDRESEPIDPDGAGGSFRIEPSDKTGRDFRRHGRLEWAGGRYLRFAGSGERFIKGGADSPENFLACSEFDGTASLKAGAGGRPGEARPSPLHRYLPHVRDWREGDPTWGGGKGKGIIGALNYLAGKGMNSVYFLTMNVGGDGDDVWPWTDPLDPSSFDVAKLDQWEVVFSHMTRLGLALHVITQETENDRLLDGGELGPDRKLYYRELIARFAHHPALVWNLGEENTNPTPRRKAFASWIKAHDPYRHPIVVHTFPPAKEEVYAPLLGFEDLDGPSLQVADQVDVHAETLRWIDRSAGAGRPWFVCLDEIGPADVGVKPDADDPGHDGVRRHSLWGNLLAGGAGVEWYFGYKFAHNDLDCEDWRSREKMWDQTRIALEFFQRHLPFWEMRHGDELASTGGGFCLAKPGEVYALYLPEGGTAELDLGESSGTFRVSWLDPRSGGDLQEGPVREARGPGKVSLGPPPAEREKDWVALVRR